jgi:eukaryotic-like serine/threonine-protein kinase
MRLGGLTEVAREIGVSRQRALQLRQRPDFPLPLDEIAQGAIWDLDAVQVWASSGLRQSRSGRPPADQAARTYGGRFVIELPEIGKGGFANVYRALDRRTNELVAVKVLRRLDKLDLASVRRFHRELAILEAIDHPNVVRVLGQGTTSGEIWYAMPLAFGSLADFMKEIAGDIPLVLDVVLQVCAGLAQVHALGVWHRDIKPENILRLESGAWAVSDFGLASREVDNDLASTSDQKGMGSIWYTAPEQWRSAMNANALSDIYSMGRVLQELVTGQVPVGEEMNSHVLKPVILRACAHRPEDRYQSIGELAAAVSRAITTTEQIQAWADIEAAAETLRDRVQNPATPVSELRSVIDWAERLDDTDTAHMAALARVLPWLSSSSIHWLWSENRRAWLAVFDSFCRFGADARFGFEYCDQIANFVHRAFNSTLDVRVLTNAVALLANLGPNHNRWHVRDILIDILSQLRDDELTVAALESLRSIPTEKLEWCLPDFALRIMPPAVRSGLEDRLASDEAGRRARVSPPAE